MDVTPEYLLSLSFALLCWICGWLALGGIRFLASPGRRRTASPPPPFRRLSVIIPARNEAGSIGTLLDSLANAAPEETPVEVIVVDDGSSDRTAEIAATRGVRTIPAGSLHAGWPGLRRSPRCGRRTRH
ncbi:MAG: glycosyltransferase family 2 protein, partial [Alkalispirochaeta sp.]